MSVASATVSHMSLLARVAQRLGLAGPAYGGSLEVLSPVSDQSHLGKLVVTDLWGEDAAEQLPIGRADAMSVPAVAKARHMLAATAGRMALRTYRDADLLVDQHLLEQPEWSPARPRASTITWTVDALIFYGRAWWVVNHRYADTGRPRSFRWVPEWEAKFDDRGLLVGAADGSRFNQDDVVRIDGPHEGILNFGATTLRQAKRLDRAALRVAENPIPAIELHQTTPDSLEPDEIDALIAKWASARRKTGIAYTNAAIEARPHSGLAVEQLLIEGRKHQALEIARMMGVPAWVVDAEVGGSSLTYSNVPARARELVDYGLLSYLTPIEARLSMDDVLPRGVWCRFDLDDLLRGDFADRMTAYKTAVDAGVYTPDELRAREDGHPVETTEETR